ncbi:MAG: FAD-dependent oxidoreductase, partial [Mesorhizobium sp.]
MQSKSLQKIVVIGGGIAGLSLAAAVQSWAEITVLEREP